MSDCLMVNAQVFAQSGIRQSFSRTGRTEKPRLRMLPFVALRALPQKTTQLA